MQDVDFLKYDKINYKTILLWVMTLFLLFLIYTVLLVNDYKELMEIKKSLSRLSPVNEILVEGNKNIGEKVSNNSKIQQLLNYFSHIEGGNVVVTFIDIDQSLSLKASGEALDIESISAWVMVMTAHPLFANYSDYRLSIDQLNLKEAGLAWSIEWLP